MTVNVTEKQSDLLIHGCMKRPGNTVGFKTLFIPFKVAQWRIKPKMEQLEIQRVTGDFGR